MKIGMERERAQSISKTMGISLVNIPNQTTRNVLKKLIQKITALKHKFVQRKSKEYEVILELH